MTVVALQDRHYLEWYAYDHDGGFLPTLVMDSRALDYSGLMFTSLSGMSDSLADPRSTKSPGQVGETLIDLEIPSRVVGVDLIVAASEQDREGFWELRSKLIDAFYVPKPRQGERPRLGRLVLYRPGQIPVELECLPRKAPKEGNKIDAAAQAFRVELYAPEPYWRTVQEIEATLQAQGALEFPLEMPFEMATQDVLASIDNVGSVESPVIIRIYGDATNPRVENRLTGEVISLTGQILDGDYVEINTQYGRKAVTYHHSNGDTENWLSKLDMDISTFWHLVRGPQDVAFEAAINISGSVQVSWRPQFAGV